MKAWVKAGVQVVHLVLIGGIYETAYGTIVLAGARLEDAIAAADALGTHLLMYEGVPENKGISHVGEIVKELDYWIKNLQPSEVYTCLPWFNQDHEAVHKATLAAMRRHFSCRFWAYEMPQQGLGYQMPEFGWEYVRMSPESRTAKAAAIHAYEPTQKLFSKDGPISWKGADALARMRGSEVGVDYAERFLLLRGS